MIRNRRDRNIWIPFTITVDTTISGTSNSDQFKIPFVGTIHTKVDWGDGNTDLITSPAQPET